MLDIKKLNLGEEIAWGSYSTIINPSEEYKHKDLLLLITEDEDKSLYLKTLYPLYDLEFKDKGLISDDIYGMYIPELKKTTIFDINIISAFNYVNDFFADEYFYSGYEFEENSPSSIFDRYYDEFGIKQSNYSKRISSSISSAFYALLIVKESFSFRIDLHDKQFCSNGDDIICIDPVIFE